jgi:glycosidase
MIRREQILREIQVSRAARDRYQFDDTLFCQRGDAVFANFHGARVFAQRMNERRDLVRFPELSVSAGQINAMGLIHEVLHLVIASYRQQKCPLVMTDALEFLEQSCGRSVVDELLTTFVDEFPPVAVYRRRLSVADYLGGESDGVSHRAVVLEEILLLWLANANPAFAPYQELHDDSRLRKLTAYCQVLESLESFFETLPEPGWGFHSLIAMLRAPALAYPHSIEGQLEDIRRRWAALLGSLLYRLLSSLDLIAEEGKAFIGVGPGPVHPPDLLLGKEVEAFSPDLDWMPQVVLLAKNAYVWLDQLSKKYERSISKLDQIPDEELDMIAGWGVTGLWLIGLWQRSRASQRIKQMMGNPEAVASAYSLDAYRVADDLGGEDAFDNLKQRLWQRGIRAASDMVPNHVGIDSRWMIAHPDWFISLDHSPFPAYSFSGPDLCNDDRVGIYLEDHYFDRTDAAVVCKRVDHYTGDALYIYHGNDGTSMPWNDTAQLDYRKPEVREAVIQTILSVARRSPIIRFDAAMTLTKQHFQRLWFPEPGSGGDIPSRADAAMSRHDFDAAMPQEFWREVVDRVAAEAPDTLLLAEAFWLLEGFFVRTLGMHRVYNSAFMNMLRDERNADYRRLIRETMEYDPEILKRYVNFMSNPDERTAVDQFGKDDKYFGICTLMATLPGLPMLGHGQVEGYTEKYGMEYRRAYWNESPDQWLVERHERQIFPLLRRRHLFAGVDQFRLFDLYQHDGTVNEDVFAYSNRAGEDPVLVLYHNRYAEARGWLHTSTPVAVRQVDGDRRMVRSSLADSLGLSADPHAFLIMADAVSGLELIRPCAELHSDGLYAELDAYQLQVFVTLREVYDDESQRYAKVCRQLSGRGVPSIEEAIAEIFLEPVRVVFRRLVSADTVRRFGSVRGQADTVAATELLDELTAVTVDLGQAIRQVQGAAGDEQELADTTRGRLQSILALPSLHELDRDNRQLQAAVTMVNEGLDENPAVWGALLAWAVTLGLGAMLDPGSNDRAGAERSRTTIDEWFLGKIISSALEELEVPQATARRAVATVKLLLSSHRWFERAGRTGAAHRLLQQMLAQPEAQAILGINRYRGILWFSQESFAELAWWLLTVATVEIAADADGEVSERILTAYQLIERLRRAEKSSGYQVDQLLTASTD